MFSTCCISTLYKSMKFMYIMCSLLYFMMSLVILSQFIGLSLQPFIHLSVKCLLEFTVYRIRFYQLKEML